MDLVGGYYDAGDNVKFGLPMAFTVTMMSWSILEYGDQMAAAGELGHAVEAVKWGTDYFVKAHPEPNVLYGEVGPLVGFQVLVHCTSAPCLPLTRLHCQLLLIARQHGHSCFGAARRRTCI